MLSVRLVFAHLGAPAVRQPLSAKALGEPGARYLSVNTRLSLEPQQNLNVEIEIGPNEV